MALRTSTREPEATPAAASARSSSSGPLRRRIVRLRRSNARLAVALQRTVLSAGAHGSFNLAQSTAYSAIVALFPTLIVAAAVIGLLPDTAPVRFQLAAFFDRVLPPGVTPLLDAAFEYSPAHAHSLRALVTAALVSFLGASNIISTLMEGLRRARDLPTSCWSFWQRRRRTFSLVPLSLVPLAAASLLIVFGHALTQLLVSSIGPGSRGPIYMTAVLVRWAICFAASVGVIGMIYHLGVPDGNFTLPISAAIPTAAKDSIPAPIATAHRRSRALLRAASRSAIASALITPSFASSPGGEQRIVLPPRRWHTVLPGAIMATATWFLATLAFGWYVTRFANYGEVYGSIGAAIALLIWLYIVSLSVLCGAEFNAQLDMLPAVPLGVRATAAPGHEAQAGAATTSAAAPTTAP